jgi:CRISPR-associated protein Cas4
MSNEKITGIMIYYYFVCKRKLWLSYNDISMEDENENVQIGKFIDENTYKSERRHILINNEINIDFIKSSGMLHEIKKSRKIEEASIWQVKYYLYYLKAYGINDISAKIDYPLLKKTLDVELSKDDEKFIENILENIRDIIKDEKIPPYKNEKMCKKCAFYDLCAL